MTASTYTTEEVIIERELNKLYGIAIGRSQNKAVKEEADKSFTMVIALLWKQWRRELE
jgi:hypothetical protein